MSVYHVSGIVEYTSVLVDKNNKDNVMTRKISHAFTRDISGADSAQEAYQMTEDALIKKYIRRPSFVAEHKDIHITYCKVYELKEVFGQE